MTKTIIKLFAVAALVVLSVSCERELLSDDLSEGAVRTIQLGFESTKTTISETGLTLWAEGDSLWVTNGTATEIWHVPSEAVGKDVFSVQTTLQGELKVVYPYSAAKGLTEDGLFKINVPSTMEGSDFGKANIAVAVVKAGEGTEETRTASVKMKNVTGVMKFRISTSAMYPPKAVGLSAPGQIIAGDCTVDLSSGVPEVRSASGSSMILVTGTEGGGTFYASVIPCELKEGFSYIGVGVDLDCESISSTQTNTIAANDMVDLGEFGTRELKPLEGEGTEASPYLIHNLPEWLALTYYVNENPENTLEGKYVKVTDDINGISIPVGGNVDGQEYCFRGKVDGSGKTLKVNISGGNNTGLFAIVRDGFAIHDVVIEGSVTGATSTAALVGYAYHDADTLFFTNCTNKAAVNGEYQTGGIIGFSGGKNTTKVEVINCTNEGAVTGTCAVGGLCGYTYFTNFSESSNTGAVTATVTGGQVYTIVGGYFRFANIDGSGNTGTGNLGAFGTRGVGGIAGYTQNSNILSCNNGGTINGVSKVGGIAGSMYWSTVSKCTNTGSVTGSDNFVGGIAGWGYVIANFAEDTNNGPVAGNMMVGGILGFFNGGSSTYSASLKNSTNKGSVTANGKCAVLGYNASNTVSAAGGIVGACEELFVKNGSKSNHFVIDGNVNEGAVSGVGNAVGGITGYVYHFQNSMMNGYTANCVNKGSVTGNACVGGIIGQCWYRFTSSYHSIYNCENHGDVLATAAEANTVYAGGIVGWCSALYPSTSHRKSPVYNSYNTGKVQYSNAAAMAPDAGGIYGFARQMDCKNVYNSGAVCPASGSAAEGAADYLGALAGYVGDYTLFNNGYYLDPEKKLSAYGAKTGATSVTIGEQISSCDAEGMFPSIVTIVGEDYDNVVPALNAWVGDATQYKKWTAGPKFVTE